MLALAWAAACVALGVGAWTDLRSGARVLERGREAIDLDELTSPAPARTLQEAAQEFDRADRRLSSPLLAPVRFLPVVGRQLRAAQALAASAADVTSTGSTIAADVREALLALPTGGPERLDALDDLEEAFRRAIAVLDRVDLGPSNALVGSLADQRERMEQELVETSDALDDGLAMTKAAQDVLRGPRRYLVVAANNAEMRAGSGMFLQVGTLRTENGGFSLTDMRPVHDLTLPVAVPVTGDLEERWGFTELGREWRNLASSPRFPTSAEVAARMWEAASGEAVDGVLAIDVAAVALLIEAAGGIDVGDQRLDRESAERFLLHDQYLTIEEGGTAERDSQRERRDLLGDLAQTLVAEIEAGRVDTAKLITAMRTSSRGRHVLVWSKDPDVQTAWSAAGVAGELTDRSMLLSVMNRGGNKLDPYLQIDATLARSGDDVEVRVEIDNRTPRDEVPYVAGPHPDVPVEAGSYVGFVSLNVPGAATDITIDGGPIVTAGADGPTRVAATQVVVPRDETLVVTFRFVLPTTEVRIEPSARVPPVRWHHAGDTFRDRRPRQIVL